MWKKTLVLTLVLALVGCGSVKSQLLEEGPPEGWKETQAALPPYPQDLNAPNWFPLYVDETYPTEVRIDMDSVTLEPDRTIRYVINERSRAGVDNLRVAATYCPARLFKIYAYGDSYTHTWMPNPDAAWESLVKGTSSRNRVNALMGRIFCDEGMPISHADMLGRIRIRGSR